MKPTIRISLVVILFTLVMSAPNHAVSESRMSEAADSEKVGEFELTGIISVIDLVKEVVHETGYVFFYNPSQLRGREVAMIGKIERPTTSSEWLNLLGDLLRRIDYTYLRIPNQSSPRQYEIVPTQQAGSKAAPPASNPSDLPEDAYWGCLIVHLRVADANSMQRALLNLSTRPGGVVQPIVGANALMIVDYRDQLERIYEVIQIVEGNRRPGWDDEDGDEVDEEDWGNED